MRHAKIVDSCEQVFDWDKAKEASDNAYNEETGQPNWAALMWADPGAAQCPQCEEYFWKEALELECPDCGTQWNTNTDEVIE